MSNDDVIEKLIELNNSLRTINYKNDNVLKSKLIESNDEVNLTKLKYYKLKNLINIFENDIDILKNSAAKTAAPTALPTIAPAAAPTALPTIAPTTAPLPTIAPTPTTAARAAAPPALPIERRHSRSTKKL